TLDDVAEVFARTPLLADLQPGGRYLAADVHSAGGVDAVLKALLDGGHLHGDALTLSGRTMAEHLAHHRGPDGEVVRSAARPLSPTGGVVMLRGNLAPDGALIKVAGLKTLKFEGRALVFDGEEACAAAVQKRQYQGGDVLIIRNEGPKGGPGMREMLGVSALIYGQGMGEKVALVTDGRYSGATRGRRGRADCVGARRRPGAHRLHRALHRSVDSRRGNGRPPRGLCASPAGAPCRRAREIRQAGGSRSRRCRNPCWRGHLAAGVAEEEFGPPHFGQRGLRKGLDAHYPQMSRWGHTKFGRISTMSRLAGTAFVAAAVLGAVAPAALPRPAAAQT